MRLLGFVFKAFHIKSVLWKCSYFHREFQNSSLTKHITAALPQNRLDPSSFTSKNEHLIQWPLNSESKFSSNFYINIHRLISYGRLQFLFSLSLLQIGWLYIHRIYVQIFGSAHAYCQHSRIIFHYFFNKVSKN